MDSNVVDVALAAALVPILTGLGQALKSAVNLPPRVVPVVNVGLGVVLAVGYTAATQWPNITGGQWAIATLTGVVVGLTSAHLYDAGKAVAAGNNS